MKIGKIYEYHNHYTVMIKNGLFGNWEWGDCFENERQARYYTEEQKCLFTFKVKEDDKYN